MNHFHSVDRLINLISIFQKPKLDFSKKRVDHDDITGDAYEYLTRHFATESGKSKGRFYTPSEVSRGIARFIGITPENAVASTTARDLIPKPLISPAILPKNRTNRTPFRPN